MFPLSNAPTPPRGAYDVVIIGAGISGINTAFHLQNQLPNLRYAIIEGRDKIGGTWDLFRYPGIRSDTDLQSFGFAWRPWTEDRAIADGESIARYLAESAAEAGIYSNIHFQHEAKTANWRPESQAWALEVETNGRRLEMEARFLVLGSGYYDYKEPLQPNIPGLSNFRGQVVHPQFWPDNLDMAGKRVVIIGSGATAITLLPNIAKVARSTTMLQRSPTYILSIDNATNNSLYTEYSRNRGGSRLGADIIVTATGLKLGLGGRIQFSVAGKAVDLADRYAWRSVLFQDIPNLAFMIGYVNASWTLGAETSAQTLCRLLRHMDSKSLTSATPRIPASIQPVPLWNLNSTYVKEAANALPKCGDSGPWVGRSNYFLDLFKARFSSITEDLEFAKGD
ncbi:unnamed protein product [Parascedosporium putredinis]|uniref:Monooxygenase n=1 Tax=Parascedosporium putredinis TaxID=1442378 RepID=A0A9P1M7E9_9PEZI|nr:unnamed protein product [Parascedosporium putredinis]CAI7990337.1 unnamed protein product [Parascedosporium putredinis]